MAVCRHPSTTVQWFVMQPDPVLCKLCIMHSTCINTAQYSNLAQPKHTWYTRRLLYIWYTSVCRFSPAQCGTTTPLSGQAPLSPSHAPPPATHTHTHTACFAWRCWRAQACGDHASPPAPAPACAPPPPLLSRAWGCLSPQPGLLLLALPPSAGCSLLRLQLE